MNQASNGLLTHNALQESVDEPLKGIFDSSYASDVGSSMPFSGSGKESVARSLKNMFNRACASDAGSAMSLSRSGFCMDTEHARSVQLSSNDSNSVV